MFAVATTHVRVAFVKRSASLLRSVEPSLPSLGVNLLSYWLDPLSRLGLDSDGMTRVISTLLTREGVAHKAMVGSFLIPDVGGLDPHYWIELPDGHCIDFRAREWLGDDCRIPHGVFIPKNEVKYVGDEMDATVHPIIFWLLSGTSLAMYPRPPGR